MEATAMSFERDPDGNWCGRGALQFEEYATAASPGAIEETLAPNAKGEAVAIYAHLASAGGATDVLSLTFDAYAGVKHDAVIMSESLNGVTDFAKTFDPPLPFDRGDEIDVAFNNAGTVAAGVRLAWRKVG
jgi:hypothetical protein